MLVAGLAIILTLLLVVGLHEVGHALMARLFAVRIKRISIGFGKPLIQWSTKSGCEWVWAIWPLGGYVQLLNSRISSVNPKEYNHCFDKKPIWMRLLVLIAGALANLLTAWLAFLLVFSIGIDYKVPQIQSVQPQSISAQAGILAGDQFVAINNYLTTSWQEVGMGLITHWGKKEVKIKLKQASGEFKELTLNLSGIKFTGKERSLLGSMGLVPNPHSANGMLQSVNFLDAIYKVNQTIVHLIYFFLMVLKQLFSGIIPFSMLLGPLGLFAASVASLTQGFVMFMYFIATFSVAVALINLFPIPGLDGGSIVYNLIEAIRGKPISVAMEVLLHRLVLILFSVLLVNLLLNDVQRLLS